jgi:hypothetical protein
LRQVELCRIIAKTVHRLRNAPLSRFGDSLAEARYQSLKHNRLANAPALAGLPTR